MDNELLECRSRHTCSNDAWIGDLLFRNPWYPGLFKATAVWRMQCFSSCASAQAACHLCLEHSSALSFRSQLPLLLQDTSWAFLLESILDPNHPVSAPPLLGWVCAYVALIMLESSASHSGLWAPPPPPRIGTVFSFCATKCQARGEIEQVINKCCWMNRQLILKYGLLIN